MKASLRESAARPGSVWWVLSVLVLLACPAEVALGSDTGHHADLTRDALQEAGFHPDAIRMVQVTNWLTDFYSNLPTFGLNTDFAEIRAEVEKLHFDNREADDGKLADFDSISRYWSHLTKNTRDAVRKAATDDDPLMLLSVLGISLHAVQDFYSHSNWVEKHPRAANAPYRTETWFSELAKAPIDGLKSGRFPNVGVSPDNHGKYTGPGLNQDSYVRPRWDEAYAFAFAASVQWVRAAKGWADEVNPDFWAKARTLPATAGLDADAEASFRISEWVSGGGNDGHWKGNGSGSLAEFAPFALGWMKAPDSPLVKQFKEAKVYTLLTPGLYTDATTTFPPVRRAAVHREAVLVRTLDVHVKDDLDPLEPAIDPLGDPDFYAVVTIEGNPYTETMQLDRSSITPSWTSFRILPAGIGKVAVTYSLFDEDGAVRGDDDHCDINPEAGVLDVSLPFTLSDGSRSVASEGAKPDKDRAVVSFRVQADSLAPLPPLTIAAGVGMGAPTTRTTSRPSRSSSTPSRRTRAARTSSSSSTA